MEKSTIPPQLTKDLHERFPYLQGDTHGSWICELGHPCIDGQTAANINKYSTIQDKKPTEPFQRIIAIRAMVASSCANCPFINEEGGSINGKN